MRRLLVAARVVRRLQPGSAMATRALTVGEGAADVPNGTRRVSLPVMLLWVCAFAGLGAYLLPSLAHLAP